MVTRPVTSRYVSFCSDDLTLEDILTAISNASLNGAEGSLSGIHRQLRRSAHIRRAAKKHHVEIAMDRPFAQRPLISDKQITAQEMGQARVPNCEGSRARGYCTSIAETIASPLVGLNSRMTMPSFAFTSKCC